MTSSWEKSKAKSNYHFDAKIKDAPESVMTYLGHIHPGPGWGRAVKEIIAQARPATWATRGYKGEGRDIPPEDLAGEEYDLTSRGMPADLPITHLSWTLPPEYQAVVDAFGMDNCMARLHVQHPGEMWNLHIDKLEKFHPEDPTRVMRLFMQLTDWKPGQFWEFGNYHWNQWRWGDVVTFDWANMPHCTANAGHHPRVTLQITGVPTERTQRQLAWLERMKM